jgi:sorting nexin-14
LSNWVAPKLHNGFKCSQCQKHNCNAHLDKDPSSGFKIPVEIDVALEDFLETLLNEFVYTWYREISYDEDFVQEIRHVLQHSVANLTKRIYRLDLTLLITKRVIPSALCHLDALIHAENFVKSDQNTREINLELRQAFLDYMGSGIHQAALSRVKEVDYTQGLVTSLVPLLLPPRYKSSK